MSLETNIKKTPEAGAKSAESSPDLKRSTELQDKLSHLQESMRQRYAVERRSAIDSAKMSAGVKLPTAAISETQIKPDSATILSDISEENTVDRAVKYDQLLKAEISPDSMDVREFAFSEITDWKFNQEKFRGKGGWLEEYDKMANPQQSLEEFTLIKQYQELESIRNDLLSARTRSLIPDLFPDLKAEGEEIKAKRELKSKDIDAKAINYFKENKASVEKLLTEDLADKEKIRKQLYESFTNNVFAEENLNPEFLKAGGLIDKYFQNLLDDYASMLTQMDLVKVNNPLMVELMVKGATEEEWMKKLSEFSKKKAEQLKEKEKDKKDKVLDLSSQPVDLKTNYYGTKIDTVEKLGSSSVIQFNPVLGEKGSYQVVFPGTNNESKSITYLQVRMERDLNTGEQRQVYLFRDDYMDGVTKVDDRQFKSMINARYLDHAMNTGIKNGEDYLGPSLNDILRDEPMVELAQKFFYPKDFGDYVLTPNDVDLFKKLMKVLTNKSNNTEREGDYGNLLPINRRISLIKLALTVDGGSKAEIMRRFLSNSDDKLNNLSISALVKQLGVPANSGNFS